MCLNTAGKSVFTDLLFGRGIARFYAFDLLFCDGEDLRYMVLRDDAFQVVPRPAAR